MRCLWSLELRFFCGVCIWTQDANCMLHLEELFGRKIFEVSHGLRRCAYKIGLNKC
jgi:hypothetical protein